MTTNEEPMKPVYMKRTPGQICVGPECDKPVWARGVCPGHYTQLRRGQHLRPLRKKKSTV